MPTLEDYQNKLKELVKVFQEARSIWMSLSERDKIGVLAPVNFVSDDIVVLADTI